MMWIRAQVWAMAMLVLLSACQPAPSYTVAKPNGDPLALAKETVEKSPGFENWINLGLELANHGQRPEALQAYLKAKEISPNSPLVWNNICAELNFQGRVFEALPNCEKALELEPKFMLSRRNLEWTRAEVKKRSVPVAEKIRELKNKPQLSNEDILVAGLLYYDQKRHDDAIQIWQLATPSDAVYGKVRNNMASVLILQKRWREAERLLNEALATDPQNQLYLNNLKWLNEEKAKTSVSASGSETPRR